MRFLVLSNPIAGGGRARTASERLVRALQAAGHDVELHFTTGIGDAGRTAAEREGQVDRIVVVGGDGTLNEVLNGLAEPWRTPLTQLAHGTANLLARELRLPRRPESLARVAVGSTIRRLDLAHIRETLGTGRERGDARGKRFLLVASCGFDAEVVEIIGRTRRSSLGFAGYAIPILRAVSRYRPPGLRVRVEAESLDAQLVVVSNVRNYGGLFVVTDRARPDSGHLDVCLVRRADVLDMVRYAWAGIRGRISRLPGVLYRTGRHVSIDSDRPVAVEVDGDYFGTTPVAIEVEPRVVPVLVTPAVAARGAEGRSP